MGETGKPDKSQDPFQNRTCVRKHDTASQESHSENHRDKQGGSEVGITQYCIQHGEILLFDEADRIKGGFGLEKRVKYRLFQSWRLEKRRQNANVMYRKISFGDQTNGIPIKKALIEGSSILSRQAPGIPHRHAPPWHYAHGHQARNKLPAKIIIPLIFPSIYHQNQPF